MVLLCLLVYFTQQQQDKWPRELNKYKQPKTNITIPLKTTPIKTCPWPRHNNGIKNVPVAFPIGTQQYRDRTRGLSGGTLNRGSVYWCFTPYGSIEIKAHLYQLTDPTRITAPCRVTWIYTVPSRHTSHAYSSLWTCRAESSYLYHTIEASGMYLKIFFQTNGGWIIHTCTIILI